jgi:hypothetical protein
MKIYTYQAQDLTETILNWVLANLNAEDIYEEADLLARIKLNYAPEDVFSLVVLEDWAFENGFRKFE